MRRTAIVVAAVVLTACSGIETATEPPRLTETYGCGHGFYLGDGDQTAGLFIWADAGFGEEVPVGGYSLPTSGWNGELRFGADLFANWCDDVLEPGEPEPVVDEAWQVSGDLEVIELPPPGECGPARGILNDASAENEEGAVLTLGDVELTNGSWGCFAG